MLSWLFFSYSCSVSWCYYLNVVSKCCHDFLFHIHVHCLDAIILLVMLSWLSFSYSCSVSWCYYLVSNVVMIFLFIFMFSVLMLLSCQKCCHDFPFHIHVQCLDAIILSVMLSWLSFSYSCSVSWCYYLVSNVVMTFFFIFMFSVLMLLSCQ